jgi:hypothetical protein
VNDKMFGSAVTAIVAAGLGALVWRTGGIDLPNLAATGVEVWVVVALVVVAAASLLVGVLAKGLRR